MANGDAAAAASMAVVGATDKVRMAYDEINKTRDYLAPIKTDVNSATANAVAGRLVRYGLNALVSVGAPVHALNAVNKQYCDANTTPTTNAGLLTTGTLTRPVSTDGSGRFGAAWNNNITGTRRAAWIEANGTLGHTASSARYKKNIHPVTPLTDEEFAALSVVTFQWRANVDQSEHVETGMIAEHLDELGLDWAVFYDEQGRPEGIHYDRIVLAVIPYVQQLATRIKTLEES